MDFITIKSHNTPTVMLLLNFITFLNHICVTVSYQTMYESETQSQSCLTLCDPMDYTVDGILQTRNLSR